MRLKINDTHAQHKDVNKVLILVGVTILSVLFLAGSCLTTNHKFKHHNMSFQLSNLQ